MIRRALVLLALLLPVAAFGAAAIGGAAARAETVTVGSKNFTEQFVVAEIYAAALEQAGFTVRRRINLGATLVAHEAVRTGAIDLYPEYTGTGLLAVMKAEPDADPESVLAKVRAFYEREFGLFWLTPSRVNNGNALVVRREVAERHGLKNLSDLARVAPALRLAGGSEFFDRYDGVPGLRAVYGIRFGEARQFAALRLRYDALESREADVANGFSTDWQIAADSFVELTDDKGLFPPYRLAPVVRREVAANPRIVAALDAVNARLDTATMAELNRRVEVGKEEPRKVAAEFLAGTGAFRERASWTVTNLDTLLAATGQHVVLVLLGLAVTVAIAVPLGIGSARRPVLYGIVLGATGLLYTVPALAIFALLVPVLGLGIAPALVAIVMYSLLILTRNVALGLRGIPPAILDAADAMGFTPLRRLLRVELPLAAPTFLAGLRLTVVTQISVATVGAFIGAGGLGDLIFQGIAQDLGEKVAAGAVAASLLAVAADDALRRLEESFRARTGSTA